MTFYNRIEHPVYFNDFDEGACAWIAELMKQGHIPPGEIDRRSILEVKPDDVKGFTQCHFFAGIGGWAYALRLAGVPVNVSLWTGSPPCQPFSVAGRQKGRDDERHLAPQFADLVRACKPSLLLGEQVASAEVFGKAGNKDVHPLWRREELLRFLDDSIQWELAQRLSGLPQQVRQGTSFSETRDHTSQSDSNACECKIEGKQTWGAVRPDSGLLGSETKHRCLRGDGNSVLDDIEEGVGLAFNGQDCSVEWLHSGECQDGSIFGEHGLLRLGRGSREVCSTRDLEDAHSKIKRTLEETRRDIEASSGWTWIDALHSDLEGSHYTIGALDFPSAGVGAPHIRQRTYFGAVAHEWLEHASRNGRIELGTEPSQRGAGIGRGACGLADFDSEGSLPGAQRGIYRGQEGSGSRDGEPERSGAACGLGDCLGSGLEGLGWNGDGSREPGRIVSDALGSASEAGTVGEGRPGPTNGFWGTADWLFCRDERFRPVESGAFEVAHGLPEDLGHLRLERDGENENGQEGQTGTGEILQDLRLEDGEAAVQRSAGRPDGFQEAALLQSGLYGCGLRGRDQGDERQEQSSPIGQDAEGELRNLREDGSSCSSSGREPAEQRSGELTEPLCFLSQEGTPPDGSFPLAQGVRHRVELLRGYGNAINPQQAAVFIRAFFEALEITSEDESTSDDGPTDGLIV